MKKLLLTTLNSKYIHSSLSIRYLNEYIKDLDISIQIEEFTINQNNDYITSEIFKMDVDIVAFSCYIWNIEEILDISKRLKLVKPDIDIILGGPEVSFEMEDILKSNKQIDYIIYGEGEETLREFIKNYDNSEFDYINGLAFRDYCDIKVNPSRSPIKNLDGIPSPFENVDLNIFKNKIVYYESSRGCPFNCKFCLSSTLNGVRFFSLDRVKRDLKKLIDADVKQVKFVDRTFNTNKEFAMEIMRFIINNNDKDINFHFEVTAHLLDDEMLDFLKDVKEGLFQFEIGVQSTNEKTIQAIGRTTNFERLKYVVKTINSYKNIHQHLDLIVGLPFEDYDTFKNSFNDVYNLQPEKLQLGFLKLLKGSELRNREEKYGFKYINKPPYEVMENNYMDYSSILKLKTVEELVEKYGNELNFKNTIKYIINNYFETPFDFYESLAEYWEKNEYNKVSHSLKKLYKILYKYYEEEIKDNIELFNEVIKYDYIFNNNKVLPNYILSYGKEDLKKLRHDFLREEDNIKKYLPSYINKPAKKIIKDVSFVEFKFDILNFIYYDCLIDNIVSGNRIILFNHKGKDKVFTKSKVNDVTKEIKKMR